MPSAAVAVRQAPSHVPPPNPYPAAPSFVMLAEPHLFVIVRYRGIPLMGQLLSALADERSRQGRFTIGLTTRAHAPTDPVFLAPGKSDHDLLVAEGAGFRLQLPAGATLLANDVGEAAAHSLAMAIGESPALLRLGHEGLLSVQIGAVTVEISRAEGQSRLAMASWFLNMNATEAASYGASCLFLMMWMLIFRMTPADPEALSFDMMGAQRHRLPWTLIPVQIAEPPPSGAGPANNNGARDPAKTASTVGSRNVQHAPVYSPRIHTPKAGSPTSSADSVTRARTAGVIGLLRPDENATWAALVGRGDPLGGDAAEVLAELRGPVVAGDLTPGGLGSSGTGSKGAGTGGGLVGGGGDLLAIKDGVTAGGGRTYGRGNGQLKPKRTFAIDVIPCEASHGCSVAGSLSKEIIRRTIRRHINEIRYCYEQALPRKPSLAGRLVVSFVILPQGNVTAAALAQDTLNDPAVSQCVVQAARRWPFPQPEGGGIVKVSYPFTFAPAGGAE